MPTYKESADRVAAQASTVLADLWAQVLAGTLGRADFDVIAAGVIDTASDRTAMLADMALAARLTELRGEQTDPLGLAAPESSAAGEVAAVGGVGAVAALAVAARSATRAAGQSVWVQGIQDHGVPGWRRVHSGSDCEPCTTLAVADFIAASVRMWTHKGCGCHPDPVIAEGPVLVQGEDF